MHNSHKEQKINNITFVGKDGVGKTSLIDKILQTKSKQKNSEIVIQPEEKERGYTIYTSFYHLDSGNATYNLIDTPGNTNFLSSLNMAVVASSASIFVVSAVGDSGGALRAWESLLKNKTPRAVFVNQLDMPQANFAEALQSLEDSLQLKPAVLFIPWFENKELKGIIDVINQTLIKDTDGKIVTEDLPEAAKDDVELYRGTTYERLAELDDELMEYYIEEKPAPDELMVKVLSEGIKSCEVTPLIVGSVEMNLGLEVLWNFISKNFLPFDKGIEWEGRESKDEGAAVVEKKLSQDESFSGFIFKTSYDRYVGKLNYMLVVSGVFKKGMKLLNSAIGRKAQTGRFYIMHAEKTDEIEEAFPGDIVVLEKVEELETNHTLCDSDNIVFYEPIPMQVPKYTNKLILSNSSKDSRVMDSINKMIAEDPTIGMEFNAETNEMLISTIGLLHLDVLRDRLKNIYDVDFEVGPAQIGYLETITGSATVQGKYKKQSGGHGQYGDVHITVEPQKRNQGFEFVDKIVGGAIPRNYIPGVEKGVREALQKGVLGGYPVMDVKVTLFDGSFHAVDSSDFAFQRAGSMAIKKALPMAKPVLLEPIMELEIDVLEADVGKVTKDLSGRRGKVASYEYGELTTIVKAEAPLAELVDYTPSLRGLTLGLGIYSMKLKGYEILMQNLADKIVEERKKFLEEEED